MPCSPLRSRPKFSSGELSFLHRCLGGDDEVLADLFPPNQICVGSKSCDCLLCKHHVNFLKCIKTGELNMQHNKLKKCLGFERSMATADLLCSIQSMTLSRFGCSLTVRKADWLGWNWHLFNLEVVDDLRYSPPVDGQSVLASPVLLLSPHGARFCESAPATVKVPIGIAVGIEDVVYCLTSDTDYSEPTNWKRMEAKNLLVSGSVVQFEVTHFSLFSVVVSKAWPKAEKAICPLFGGVLESSQVPGVSVTFMPFCYTADFVASVEILGSDPFYVGNDAELLAAPIVSLGPSGSQFHSEVLVTLPLKGTQEVLRFHRGQSCLKIFCSQTEIGELPQWQVYDTAFEIGWNSSPCTVTFSVGHFTMFKILWSVMDVALPESIKLAWSPYVPQFSFWVYFVALMTEGYSQENKQFGLCILCLKYGQSVSNGLTHYPVEVGTSKPRKIHSGRLKLQLKSRIFAAAETGGESKVVGFHGVDFDVQFICHFTCDKVPDCGILGEVLICREDGVAPDEDPFSFNLIKGACREPTTSKVTGCTSQTSSDWEDQFLKELLGLLSIEDHWHELALCLGYNRSEINAKFSGVGDPSRNILVDFKGRCGTVQEFTSAVYKVAGMFKLLPLEEMRQNRQNRKIELNNKGHFGEPFEGTPTAQSSPACRTVGCKRKNDAMLFSTDVMSESKFDDFAGEISRSWKSIGRKLGIPEQELDVIERNFQHCGEKEKAFQMLLMWRERDPDDCVPERLYQVLHDSGLKFTARKCLRP